MGPGGSRFCNSAQGIIPSKGGFGDLAKSNLFSWIDDYTPKTVFFLKEISFSFRGQFSLLGTLSCGPWFLAVSERKSSPIMARPWDLGETGPRIQGGLRRVEVLFQWEFG